jgi:hypothetical protein
MEIIAGLELCFFVDLVIFCERKQKATKGMKKLGVAPCCIGRS